MRIQESSTALLEKERQRLCHGTDAHLEVPQLSGKCMEGPAAVFAMNISPTQVMRLIELDRIDNLLARNTIWVCAACGTCSTQRPPSVQIDALAGALARVDFAETAVNTENGVKLAHRLFLEDVDLFARVKEPWLVIVFNPSVARPAHDSAAHTSLPFVPKRIRGLDEILHA